MQLLKKNNDLRISILLVLSLSVVSIWCISGTIAARYILSGLALIMLLWLQPKWKTFFSQNKIVLVFFVYLLIHLFFLSSDFYSALRAFRGEWLKLMLFLIFGAGLGLLTRHLDKERLILAMGLAFCVPLVQHLFLTMKVMSSSFHIPWGYVGIVSNHGDLGYTSFSASLLLSPLLIFGSNLKDRVFAAIGLVICFLSVIIAQSRGGLIFTALPMLVMLMIFILQNRRSKKVIASIILVAGLATTLIVQFNSLNQSSKWNGMIERAKFGLIGDDPLEINCEGSEYIEQLLESQGTEITPKIQELIKFTVDGDGARVLTARGAVKLAFIYPWGFDQSKVSYQLAITKYCEEKPKIMLANAHNGWLNASLAIGLPGAVLYFLVVIGFFRQGIRGQTHSKVTSTALVLTASLWILRSMLDASMQDQMLEMQVFVMAFLAAMLAADPSENA